MSSSHASGSEQQAARYQEHAAKLSLLPPSDDSRGAKDSSAVEATFITPHDPVIKTQDGGRLPAVPVSQAVELNQLKDEANGTGKSHTKGDIAEKEAKNRKGRDGQGAQEVEETFETEAGAPLGEAVPSQWTHPLFPELPMYGPPTFARNMQCLVFRLSSSVLSLAFLMVIVLGSIFTSIPLAAKNIACRLRFKDPDSRRPFYQEEKRLQAERHRQNTEWVRHKRSGGYPLKASLGSAEAGKIPKYQPMEGGRDPLVCDAAYYARRVGLDMESFEVQTEDGFILDLWHVYDPSEQHSARPPKRDPKSPNVFVNSDDSRSSTQSPSSPHSSPSPSDGSSSHQKKYPILLIHGLLQSSGAYCTNDDSSLAFYLAKSGYDVWLGNNRCGFQPKHTLLTYKDPRMWAWNIRQMGVMDLPALISRVLRETGFSKLGLVCHSQGTTETFVALAKDQRPDLGSKISVFCALAPAVYAGPLIGKMYFKFMRIISPSMFRMVFGIHAFIPFMMAMHRLLPGKIYGALGYRVFSFLFNWTDDRWDQGLRDRCFQFAPVYVSAESMRWWLGRECFAQQKCILSTKSENQKEDQEDEEDAVESLSSRELEERAWYDAQSPPFALWVAGSDELIDGARLLRRFEKGREPKARVVHSKFIPEYEHLDVLWAVDAIEQVGREVKEVLWRTASEEGRKKCCVPEGCEHVEPWTDDR